MTCGCLCHYLSPDDLAEVSRLADAQQVTATLEKSIQQMEAEHPGLPERIDSLAIDYEAQAHPPCGKCQHTENEHVTRQVIVNGQQVARTHTCYRCPGNKTHHRFQPQEESHE